MNTISKICKDKHCNFVNVLFTKFQNINNQLNNECFLRGAFVLEDPGNEIFYYLNKGGNINRDRGSICPISHDSFFKNNIFQTKNTSKKYTIDDNNNLLKVDNKYLMYEKVLDKKLFIKCNNNKINPGVILFFPFTITKFNSYLYIKIEKNRCFGILHVINYIDSKIKLSNKQDTRGENQKYTENMKVADNEIYKNFGESVAKNIINYNKFIRVGAEFYIPKEVYNKI